MNREPMSHAYSEGDLIKQPASANALPPSDPTRPSEAAHGRTAQIGNVLKERLLLSLAGAFTMIGLLQLGLVSAYNHTTPLTGYTIESGWLIGAGTGWLIGFGVIHRQLNQRQRARDPYLLPIVALLTGWGLIEIARLAPGFLPRQVAWLSIASAVLIGVLRAPADLKWLRRYRYTWLSSGLALLALTFLIGVNPAGAGLPLWLGGLAGVFFQPAEILKLLFVAFLASYLAEKREVARSLRLRNHQPASPPSPLSQNRTTSRDFGREGAATPLSDEPPFVRRRGAGGEAEQFPFLTRPYLAPLLAMWAVSMVLLVAQQDLGSSLLLYFSFLVMLFLASGQLRYPAMGAALLVVAGIVGYGLIGRVQGRIDTWLNPWADASGTSYQVVQSLIALNSGGVIGVGLGQGDPDVILPAVHTDMPLAAIGEEFGLAGTLAVIACFSVLTLRGLRIAIVARTTFGRLLAAGLAVAIGLQAWIIMAGNAGLAPLTGVTLPFVSYGGSSLLISFISIGLLLHIGADLD
jgi:cell division protein FtsW (lipid II flippase)